MEQCCRTEAQQRRIMLQKGKNPTKNRFYALPVNTNPYGKPTKVVSKQQTVLSPISDSESKFTDKKSRVPTLCRFTSQDISGCQPRLSPICIYKHTSFQKNIKKKIKIFFSFLGFVVVSVWWRWWWGVGGGGGGVNSFWKFTTRQHCRYLYQEYKMWGCLLTDLSVRER